jgi:cytochrome oxidase Cu insertion factor (SCO1/SenC/PrrC family)
MIFSVPSSPELKNRTSAVKPGQSVGTAAIGGPFKLLNHDGKPVTEKDFLGKWTLLYFGFTHCPDICPDELQKMAAAIDKISMFLLFLGYNYLPRSCIGCLLSIDISSCLHGMYKNTVILL